VDVGHHRTITGRCIVAPDPPDLLATAHVREASPVHTPARAARALHDVRSTGAGVLVDAFDTGTVEEARRVVLAHTDLMKRTRPTPTARHLAGFHRFPALEPLHEVLTGNPLVTGALEELLGAPLRTIGLSDINIDRSQQWHKDLLRGRYRSYLGDDEVCAHHHGKAFKVILYLQDSSSLQVVPGSHRRDIDLADDEHAIPGPDDPVVTVAARAGDAVIIDLCTTHRGADEATYLSQAPGTPARILVSTVFTRAECDFADRLEAGNAARLADWSHRPEQLAPTA
jgi:hypothetical protein